jgi:outer membrane protein
MNTVRKSILVLAGLALAAPAMAYDAGTWVLRGGAGVVMPDDPAADLGEGVNLIVDDGTSLILGGTYFFSPNWALDILASAPFKHDIKVEGFGESVKIGEVKHLPPTVSMQYHFVPDGKFQPYFGVGVNYTIFSSESIDPDVADSLDVDSSVGFAAQLGADLVLNENWVLYFEARYINIEPDVTISAEGQSETVGIEINPFVVGVGFGYMFN